jgi:Gram-negative bacterial TonB protein C-terminal
MSSERVPQFAVIAKQHPQGFRRAVERIWRAEPRVYPLGIAPCGDPIRASRPLLGVSTSLVVHVGLVLLLVRIPYLVRIFLGTKATRPESHANQTVYVFRPLEPTQYFPTLHPAGPGGRPGQGSQKPQLPPIGNDAADPRGLIISAPVNPDNTRQTIVQPDSPPELRIPTELKLPNVIAGNVLPPPPEKPSPTLKIPIVTPTSLPAEPVKNSPPAAEAPALSRNLPPLEVAHLEVPLPAPPAASGATAGQPTANISELGIQAMAGANGKALLSLSVDPGPAASVIELPPGNRFGRFSIGSGAALGSPGGIANGTPGGGGAGSGPGGDMSSGVGSGTSGGGGSGSGIASVHSSGLAGTPGGGSLGPLSAASLVYPVTVVSHPRQPRMLVTSGPAGGGGLSVYGVLRGGKIYTIYLAMPGKHWILQYCESTKPADDQSAAPRSVQVRLDPILVPPSVEEQFDFHRPALPKDKIGEMIVLHGMIREDGSVAELKVLKGLEDLADQAALAAFLRWKFRPALRGGGAVPVEVLVGIPAM